MCVLGGGGIPHYRRHRHGVSPRQPTTARGGPGHAGAKRKNTPMVKDVTFIPPTPPQEKYIYSGVLSPGRKEGSRAPETAIARLTGVGQRSLSSSSKRILIKKTYLLFFVWKTFHQNFGYESELKPSYECIHQRPVMTSQDTNTLK